MACANIVQTHVFEPPKVEGRTGLQIHDNWPCHQEKNKARPLSDAPLSNDQARYVYPCTRDYLARFGASQCQYESQERRQ